VRKRLKINKLDAEVPYFEGNWLKTRTVAVATEGKRNNSQKYDMTFRGICQGKHKYFVCLGIEREFCRATYATGRDQIFVISSRCRGGTLEFKRKFQVFEGKSRTIK
jgi:hypothetical protein